MAKYLSGAQVRAARGILKWSVADLATASGISASTIKRLESVDDIPNIQTGNLQAIYDALVATKRVEFKGDTCVCIVT